MSGKLEGPDLYIGEGSRSAASPKAIGELIQDARNLSADDLDRIGRYQREHDSRFGEAAIALGLMDTEDVLQARSSSSTPTQTKRPARRRLSWSC